MAKQHANATPEEEEDNVADPDAERESEHRFLENDTGSDQDISEDDDFEDSIIDESSKIFASFYCVLSNRNSCSLCSLSLFGTRFPPQEGVTLHADLFAAIKLLSALESCNLAL